MDFLHCLTWLQSGESKQWLIVPRIKATLEIQLWTKNRQFELFMVSMVKNGISRKPSFQVLQIMKSETALTVNLLFVVFPLFLNKWFEFLNAKSWEAVSVTLFEKFSFAPLPKWFPCNEKSGIHIAIAKMFQMLWKIYFVQWKTAMSIVSNFMRGWIL